jgi:drug/metabolite transporter (DMT)-like permease
MNAIHPNKMEAYTAVLTATLLWGMSHVLTKFVVAEFNPFAVVTFRISCAALLMTAIQKFRGRQLLPMLAEWKMLIPLALGGIFVSQFGFILGLSFTTPSHGALIYTLSPIATAVLAVIFKGERLTKTKVFGISLAFTGALILATEGGIDFRSRYFIGDAIMFCAMLGWSYYTVFSINFIRKHGSVNTLTGAFIYAVPFAAIVGFIPLIQSDISEVTWKGWWSLGYLVILATVLTVHLFTFSLKHLKPTTVAVFVYLQPIVSTTGAMFLLGHSITPLFIVSTGLVFSGLYFFTFARWGAKSASRS